jgi:hypothetical protein
MLVLLGVAVSFCVFASGLIHSVQSDKFLYMLGMVMAIASVCLGVLLLSWFAVSSASVHLKWHDVRAAWSNNTPHMRQSKLRAVTAIVYGGSVHESRSVLYNMDRFSEMKAHINHKRPKFKQAWTAFTATRVQVESKQYLQSMCNTLGVKQESDAVKGVQQSAILLGAIQCISSVETTATTREAALKLLLSLSSSSSHDCKGRLGSGLAQHLYEKHILRGIGTCTY